MNESINTDEKVVEVKDFKDLEDVNGREDVVHSSLTEAISSDNQRNFYKNMQKMEDMKVFEDGNGNKIDLPGFDSILSFDEGIKELRTEIDEYKILLDNYQDEINSLNEKIDKISLHPEDDLTNQVETLTNKKVSVKDKAIRIKERLEKEKNNLMKLEAAKKEFIKNKKDTYNVKDKMNLHNEYKMKEDELKALESKIYMGTANNLDMERYEVLKKEILPEISQEMNNGKGEKLEDVQNVNVQIPSSNNDNDNESKGHEINGLNVVPGKPLNDNNRTINGVETVLSCDTKPEMRKKVSLISKASDWLKGKFSKKNDTLVMDSPINDENRLTEEQINSLAGQVNAGVSNEVNGNFNNQEVINLNNMVSQNETGINDNHIPSVNAGNVRSI